MPELRRRRRPIRPDVPLNTTTLEQSQLLVTQNDHSSRFLSLPVETLSEIVNHIPADALSLRQIYFPFKADEEIVQTRGRAIRSLCAVCHALRRIFWPQMWRDVELLTSRYAGDRLVTTRVGRWEKDMAQRLFQFFVLANDNPELANQVRTMNILTCSPSFDRAVLPTIADSLLLFPNLSSFHLHTGDRTFPSRLRELYRVFLKHEYPSITKLVLASGQSAIASCCPNLQRLYIPTQMPPNYRRITTCWLQPNFPSQKIQHLYVSRGLFLVKAIVKTMTNLKSLEFHETEDVLGPRVEPWWPPLYPCADLTCLQSLLHLTKFKLLYQRGPHNTDFASHFQQRAEEVLGQLPPQIECELRIMEHSL